jgi:hypothetical protein
MRLIDKISDKAFQQFSVLSEDNKLINFTLRYLPTQRAWIADIGDTTGLHLTTSPNILRNLVNILSYGIAIITTDGLEPFFIDDFATGRCKMYLLNSADIQSIEDGMFR